MKAIKSITRLIILHSLFWFVVQMSIAHIGTRIPKSFLKSILIYFDLFNGKKMVNFGIILLKVSKWKRLIPEGAQINNDIYDKSKLSVNIEETRRLLLK